MAKLFLAVRNHEEAVQYLGLFDTPDAARNKCSADWSELLRLREREDEGLLWQIAFDHPNVETQFVEVSCGFYEVWSVEYYKE